MTRGTLGFRGFTFESTLGFPTSSTWHEVLVGSTLPPDGGIWERDVFAANWNKSRLDVYPEFSTSFHK